MRHLSTLLSSRTSLPQRPSSSRRARTEKSAAEPPPPAPKRCLNEAAHKLGR